MCFETSTYKGLIIVSQQIHQSSGNEPRFYYGYVIVSLAFFIMVVMGGAMFTFGVFFEPLSGDFGWTRVVTSGAFSLYWVVNGILSILMGRLTDRFGPRIVVTICGVLIGLGYLLMSQIGAVWQLYLFYGVIIGAGISGSLIPQLSTVARWFVKSRGLMTGVTVAGIGVGTMIIPLLASWLISEYGWRTSYTVIGFMALVILVLAAQFLKRDPRQLGLLPYGSTDIKRRDSNSGDQGFSLRVAIRTRQFWLLSTANFSFTFCQHAVMVHVVPHATDLGVLAILAANILAIIGGLSIVGRIGIGSIADRIGNKSALIISLILVPLALAWLLVAKDTWMFYLFAAVFGFAWGGQAVMVSPLVAELFGLSSHGEVFGAVLFIINIGGALGPVLAGGIFDITGSYDWAFLACTVVSIFGLVSAVLLRLTKKPELP